jgi:hypothetical protein
VSCTPKKNIIWIATVQAFDDRSGTRELVDTAMGDIINLRKARKRAKKQQDAERAAANRASHGRTKAERVLEATRSYRRHRLLDAHKIDTGDSR